jgi:hypothetical protein
MKRKEKVDEMSTTSTHGGLMVKKNVLKMKTATVRFYIPLLLLITSCCGCELPSGLGTSSGICRYDYDPGAFMICSGYAGIGKHCVKVSLPTLSQIATCTRWPKIMNNGKHSTGEAFRAPKKVKKNGKRKCR